MDRAGRHREEMEADFACDRAEAKAGFFAMLIQHPEFQGTLKDHFQFVNLPVEERAILKACDAKTADVVLQTRGAAPRSIESSDIFGMRLGSIAKTLYKALNPTAGESSDSDGE